MWKSWELYLNPSCLLFLNHQSIWKRFFAIIFNHMRPSQSGQALLDHICMGFRFCPSSQCSAHAGWGGSEDHLDDSTAPLTLSSFFFVLSLSSSPSNTVLDEKLTLRACYLFLQLSLDLFHFSTYRKWKSLWNSVNSEVRVCVFACLSKAF